MNTKELQKKLIWVNANMQRIPLCKLASLVEELKQCAFYKEEIDLSAKRIIHSMIEVINITVRAINEREEELQKDIYGECHE